MCVDPPHSRSDGVAKVSLQAVLIKHCIFRWVSLLNGIQWWTVVCNLFYNEFESVVLLLILKIWVVKGSKSGPLFVLEKNNYGKNLNVYLFETILNCYLGLFVPVT